MNSLQVKCFVTLYDGLSPEDQTTIFNIIGNDSYRLKNMYRINNMVDISLDEFYLIGNVDDSSEHNKKSVEKWKTLRPYITSIVRSENEFILCTSPNEYKHYTVEEAATLIRELHIEGVGFDIHMEYGGSVDYLSRVLMRGGPSRNILSLPLDKFMESGDEGVGIDDEEDWENIYNERWIHFINSLKRRQSH